MNNRFGFGALHSLTQSRIERVWIAGLWAMLAAMPALAEQSEVKPQIAENSVSVVQKENSPLVEIAYTLTGEPAVVTIAIETNTLADASGEWIAVDGKGVGMLLGEANKIVYALDTPSKAYWNVAATFNGSTFNPGSVRATVTAWPTNNPPNYMVVELNPTNDYERLFLKRRYYATTNELPGGLEHVQYKTSKLLMRKIPAKDVVWWMGSPTRIGDEGWETTNDVPHKVMLTEDYYAGVYELTIGQLKCSDVYYSLGEEKISEFTQSPVADLIPAENIGHYINELRGKFTEYTFVKNGRKVGKGSVIDLLRTRTGIADLDLPTEAQWEYACRAGSGSELPCNMEYTEENLRLVAVKNSANYSHGAPVSRTGPAPVGSRMPNDWGLYDVVGNVAELCLDMIGFNSASSVQYLEAFHSSLHPEWKNGGVTTDPKGANFDENQNSNEDRNMARGGSWRDNYPLVSAFKRYQQKYDYMPNGGFRGTVGVRLFCSVKEAVK